ncbi:MAG TPA: hypothetical protein VMZ06_08805 [Candidatus Bathyarchaeia archaeon]|nr:hypothetical protein [Candidatus Bathyarchaeia archaeon]
MRNTDEHRRTRTDTDRHGRMLPGLFAAVAALLGACAADACSVPVYRWALERWAAEPYVLRVVDAGNEGQGLEALRQSKSANLIVEEEEARESGQGGRFELFYPAGVAAGPVWSGGVQLLEPQAVLDSPVRRELVRRLLDGQSAVWLLVKCGDRAKDQAVAAVLNEQIALANRTLRLPDLTGDPVLDAPGAPNVAGLRVEFSLIEIARDDESEAVLLRMLMQSEPDLERTPGDPVAFPVFGRGRVLYALVGPGINPEMILKACAFIVGPCACEIKSDNPGFDLLLEADWDSGAGGVKLAGNIELPPLPGTALASPAALPQARAEKTAVVRNAAAVVLGLVVLIGTASIVLSRRSGGGKHAGTGL